MLSLFPQLLFLAPASTMLIRVTVGLVYLYVGYRVFITARDYTRVPFPLIGHPPYWIIIVAAVLSGILGGLLVVGAWTQGLAVLAGLGALKQAVLKKWYGGIFPLSEAAALLLLAMSISLIFSGAGAFAFDWPL